MLGLALFESKQCPGCGHSLDETLDPSIAWQVEQPVKCFYCEALGVKAKQHANDIDAPYLRYRVRKVSRAAIARAKAARKRRKQKRRR